MKDTMAIAPKELPIRGQTFEIEGCVAFCIFPEKPRKPSPWVWYAPTLPRLPGEPEKWMFAQFLAAGLAVAGMDIGESFGSPAGRRLYSAFHQHLCAKGFSAKAGLLARSRGGLMLYNWAAENPQLVACIAGIYPVCNLRSYPGLAKACGAYGLPETELAARIAGHNPIDRLLPLAKAGVPILHIHGNSDTVVPLEENSAELQRRYFRLNGMMRLVIAENQGHNMWPGFFQCQELVDFVIAKAR